MATYYGILARFVDREGQIERILSDAATRLGPTWFDGRRLTEYSWEDPARIRKPWMSEFRWNVHNRMQEILKERGDVKLSIIEIDTETLIVNRLKHGY
jgi:hypothetical protein